MYCSFVLEKTQTTFTNPRQPLQYFLFNILANLPLMAQSRDQLFLLFRHQEHSKCNQEAELTISEYNISPHLWRKTALQEIRTLK